MKPPADIAEAECRVEATRQKILRAAAELEEAEEAFHEAEAALAQIKEREREKDPRAAELHACHRDPRQIWLPLPV